VILRGLPPRRSFRFATATLAVLLDLPPSAASRLATQFREPRKPNSKDGRIEALGLMHLADAAINGQTWLSW